MRARGVLLAFGLTACSGAPASGSGAQPLALRIEPAANLTRLALVPAPGWKINARLKPALELAGGSVIRFDGSALTADSAYFAEPPSATVRASDLQGTLRASVCAPNERVCRAVILRVRGTEVTSER